MLLMPGLWVAGGAGNRWIRRAGWFGSVGPPRIVHSRRRAPWLSEDVGPAGNESHVGLRAGTERAPL